MEIPYQEWLGLLLKLTHKVCVNILYPDQNDQKQTHLVYADVYQAIVKDNKWLIFL